VGCGTSEPRAQTPPAEQILLTQSWSVPAGKSLFTENHMGTLPPANAEALMGVVPGLLHRLGDACKEQQGLERAGDLTLGFEIDAAGVSQVEVTPDSALARCIAKRWTSEQDALEENPPASVQIRAHYVPRASAG
jgi:hypothetical protein